MKKTITKNDFIQGFENMGKGNTFTVCGREALYDYLTDLEKNLRMEMEFDVISICDCFAEYDSLDEALNDYGINNKKDLVENYTTIKLLNGHVIVSK